MRVLDTDTISYFLRGVPKVVERFRVTPVELVATTIINRSELLYGAWYSPRTQHYLPQVQSFLRLMRILPFNEEASSVFAEQKAALRRAGTPVADLDLLIASIALVHNATVVTNNTGHFSKIKGLNLENWA